jgi:hypothetical protein
MKPASTSSIHCHEVDVLLTHAMQSESEVCAVAETVCVDEAPWGRARRAWNLKEEE